jgi:hypothetical protein
VKRVALIERGKVTNIAAMPDSFVNTIWDGKQAVVSNVAKVGDTYANGVFTTPPPPVITPTRLQELAIKDAQGVALTDAERVEVLRLMLREQTGITPDTVAP